MKTTENTKKRLLRIKFQDKPRLDMFSRSHLQVGDTDWLIDRVEDSQTALYELELLHKKIKPSENSNVDRHFKTIIDLLKGEQIAQKE